jgi:hypothetical protein
MHPTVPAFGLVLVLGWSFAGPAYAQPAHLSRIEPIPLASGVNRIERFSADGREAIITLGWRDNGNAWGYDLFQVMMPANRGGSFWNVVGIDRSGSDHVFEDFIRDSPHTGEDMIRSIRFAHAFIGGLPATVLLTATRDTSKEEWLQRSPAMIEVYQLARANSVGTTRDYFAPVVSLRAPGLFCNADVALSQIFSLPLRTSYQGPRTRDGC